MMTTKKRRRFHVNLVVVAAAATLLTACGPPGARELRKGEQDIQKGDYSGAVTALQEATHILAEAPAPVQAKAWNLLGLALQDGGQFDAASKAYLQALKLDRNNVGINYNLGCLRSQQTNYPAAVEYLTTYLTLRPNDIQGFIWRGEAYFHAAMEKSGQEQRRLLDAARRDFEYVEKTAPSAQAENALGLLKLQSRSPGAEAVHSAATEFANALKRDPHNAAALLNLAIVSQRYLNNPRQALKLYGEYAAITPPPPRVNEVARLAHDLDLSLRISITPDTTAKPAPVPAPAPAPAVNPAPRPTQPSARVNVVTPTNPVAAIPPPSPVAAAPVETAVATPTPAQAAPTATGPPPEPPPRSSSPPPVVVQTFVDPPANPTTSVSNALPEPIASDTNPIPRKTITDRLNPLHWFPPKHKTAQDQAASGGMIQPEPPPVVPGTRYEYPFAVTPIPGDRPAAVQLASKAAVAQKAGDLAASIRAYKESIAADSTYFDAFYQWGLVDIQVRDYNGALEELHRALALREDFANARYAFAWTLQRRGYIEDAVHELGILLAQHPDDVSGHLLLGSLYAEKLKEPKLAREQYIRALALDPNNPQAANVRAWLETH